jgi:hypothetical protein
MNTDDLMNTALIAYIFFPCVPRHCVFTSHSNSGTSTFDHLCSTFDMHLLLVAHIFVTLVHLVRARIIERCILIPRRIRDKQPPRS